ncbi:MAG: ABC transporter ATP-binding protein [Clostridia bacterium]|nr:ABC transporter ATP-binding protein [Clostridia bacterium]
MEDLMIRIADVKKRYKLGQIGGTTLREELQRKIARARGKEDPTSKIGSKRGAYGEIFWALKGVSFDVKRGERVGIIGHNGAGKSTLLKLISRITAPTEGAIGLNGRITSMLEVGTGFHAELTGRENVYMNGAILGMTKKEIDRKMEEIIEFSEVRQFIDTPVKRYSSGMYVKLAFSVAAHLDSEIMIMDEVLAVGDVAFQNKCIDKMNEVSREEGRTILYVSHNMNTVRKLCDRVIVLDHGTVVFDGPTEEGIKVYLNDLQSLDKPYIDLSKKQRPKYSNNEIRMEYIKMVGKEDVVFESGEPIHFELGWTSLKDIEDLRIQLIFAYNFERSVGSSFSLPFTNAKRGEKYISKFDVDTSVFPEGKYSITIALHHLDPSTGQQYHHDFVIGACSFQIIDKQNDKKHVTWYHPGWGSVKLPSIVVSNNLAEG